MLVTRTSPLQLSSSSSLPFYCITSNDENLLTADHGNLVPLLSCRYCFYYCSWHLLFTNDLINFISSVFFFEKKLFSFEHRGNFPLSDYKRHIPMFSFHVGYRFPFYVSQLFCAQKARSGERADSCYTNIPVVKLSKRPIVQTADCHWFKWSHSGLFMIPLFTHWLSYPAVLREMFFHWKLTVLHSSEFNFVREKKAVEFVEKLNRRILE